jgi:hypothetical protein
MEERITIPVKLVIDSIGFPLDLDMTDKALAYFDHKFHRLERLILMATQAEVDALTAKLGDLGNTLKADDSAIQTEIARLQSQGVDTSALSAAVDSLAQDVDATTALVPAPTTEGSADTGSTVD